MPVVQAPLHDLCLLAPAVALTLEHSSVRGLASELASWAETLAPEDDGSFGNDDDSDTDDDMPDLDMPNLELPVAPAA